MNSSQDGCAIGDALVWVDAHAGLLAVKEVGNEFDYTGDTGGTTDQDDFVDVRLVDLGVAENLLDRVKSATEKILAKLFKASTSKGSIEVDTLEERIDFNGRLSGGRQGAFSTLASSA